MLSISATVEIYYGTCNEKIFIKYMVDWLVDWMNDWSSDYIINGLKEEMIEWSIDLRSLNICYIFLFKIIDKHDAGIFQLCYRSLLRIICWFQSDISRWIIFISLSYEYRWSMQTSANMQHVDDPSPYIARLKTILWISWGEILTMTTIYLKNWGSFIMWTWSSFG